MDAIGANKLSHDPPAFDGVNPIWIPKEQFVQLSKVDQNVIFKFNRKFKIKKGKTLVANAEN